MKNNSGNSNTIISVICSIIITCCFIISIYLIFSMTNTPIPFTKVKIIGTERTTPPLVNIITITGIPTTTITKKASASGSVTASATYSFEQTRVPIKNIIIRNKNNMIITPIVIYNIKKDEEYYLGDILTKATVPFYKVYFTPSEIANITIIKDDSGMVLGVYLLDVCSNIVPPVKTNVIQKTTSCKSTRLNNNISIINY